jgi:RNA polymerase sigma-70 factor (ECF subfamily)
LQIFAKIDQFRGQAQFSTWITRIAINHSLMHLRKIRRPLISIDAPLGDDDGAPFAMDLPHSGPTPEEAYSAIESAEFLRRQIDRLPKSGRSVFEKLYLEHLSMKQTAEILGISVAATKSRALRARRDLRKAFLGRLALNDFDMSIAAKAAKSHVSETG